MWLQILFLLLLILLNGFFAMAELALISVRRTRLKSLAEQKNSRAQLALKLTDDPTHLLSTVQIGITLISIFAGAYGGAKLSDPLGQWLGRFRIFAADGKTIAFVLVVIVISYLTLVIGELVPKRIGLVCAESIALRVARPMQILATLVSPPGWILRHSANAILHLIKLDQEQGASAASEEEVKTILAEGEVSGVFATAEKQMIEGVLRVADRSVRAIMTPRTEIVWIRLDDPPEEIREMLISSGYSRFPLCRAHIDDVVGFVQAKDLLNAVLAGQPLDLVALRREPLIVHDGTSVLKLLDLFRDSNLHIAFVADEYGSVEGIVTANDILEAITGDLPDHGSGPESKASRLEDGSWLLEGLMPVDEAESLLKLSGLQDVGDFETIAGFALAQLGRIPASGDFFIWRDHRFQIVDMDGRRIDKILVTPPSIRNPEK